MKDKTVIAILAVCVVLVILALILWQDFFMYSIILLVVSIILILVFCCMKGRSSTPKATPPTKSEPVPDEPIDAQAEEYVPGVEKASTDLSELPIETIEGIGKVYGAELRKAGIDSVEDLLGSDPQNVADICDVNLEQAERWIAMSGFAWHDDISEEDAEAIVYATGITTLESLAKADSNDMLQKIQDAVAAGTVRIPADYVFTLEKVQKWLDAAKEFF
ncbi:MAG: DUF4332 domain-containing protein [Candidatus Thorarchaeota archaeon]